MQMLENVSLKAYNTFGIDARARYFGAFQSIDDLQAVLAVNRESRIENRGEGKLKFVLGGGSNILFTSDVDGLVLKNEIKGIKKIKEDEEFVYIQSGGGETWHSFVLYCIENGWQGVENLSLIPGSVGASPIQNIGAYGVEIKDVFCELKAWHIKEKANYTFTSKDCAFGYRESVFKKKYKDQFIICHVTFRLRKKPVFNTIYGAITQELEKMGVRDLSVKAISQAVINIRSSKLPDPKQLGNAGSFFKNPVIGNEKFASLQAAFPGIVGYAANDGSVKLAAGWLIENCGPQEGISWKGYRRGDVGCHAQQALVLVNYGNGRGEEVYRLSEDILQSVNNRFGVQLEREVNIL